MSGDLETVLEEIKQKFVQKTPDYMATVQETIDLIEPKLPDLDMQDVTEFRERIHSFAGAAGQVGYPDLRMMAKDIERKCLNILQENCSDTSTEMEDAISLFMILKNKTKKLT